MTPSAARSFLRTKTSNARSYLFLVIYMIPGTPKDLLCYFAGLTDMKLPVLILIILISGLVEAL